MSIMIFKCDYRVTGHNCKDDKTMADVFKMIWINQQAVDGMALFHQFDDPHDQSKMSSMPYKLEDIQLGQTKLDLTKFRDVNFFLKKNKVEWTYNRVWVGLDQRETEFLSISGNSPYVTDASYHTR